MVRLINSLVLEGHNGVVWCLSWSNSGKTLASCGEDRTIKLWTAKDEVWHCIKSIETSHEKTIRSIKWSPCDNLIASCGFDGRISIWKEGEECATILEETEFKSVDWSPDGLYLASCGRDKTIYIWERVSDEEFESITNLVGHRQDVKRVKWHPLSQDLFSVSYDNSVQSYSYSDDFENWICNFKSAKHTSTVWSIDFNKDGSKMVTCSADKTLRIWSKKEEENEPTAWQCLQCIAGHHDLPVYDVCWCKENDIIATACGDNAIRIFSGNDEDPSYDLQLTLSEAHFQDVNCVSWNPSIIGLLASCSDDGQIKLWVFDSE